MTKEELFDRWISMIEADLIRGSNLKYASLEYREALRAAFYAGLLADKIMGQVS